MKKQENNQKETAACRRSMENSSQKKTCELVIFSEAETGGILQKKVFLKLSKISQENTCVGASF